MSFSKNNRPVSRWMPLFLIPAVLGGPMTQAQEAVSKNGYSYICQMTVQGEEDGKPTTPPPVVMRTETLGQKARIDIVSGLDPNNKDNKSFVNGDYLITEDGGKTFTIVNLTKRKWRTRTVDQLAEEDLDLEGAKLSLTSFQETPEPVPGTEMIAGQETRKIRLTRNAKVKVTAMLFMTQRVEMQSKAEYWYKPELNVIPNPVVAYYNAATRSLLAKADKKRLPMLTASDANLYNGFPMKAVWTQKITTGKGKPAESSATLEVKDFQPVSVRPERFTIPAGLQREK